MIYSDYDWAPVKIAAFKSLVRLGTFALLLCGVIAVVADDYAVGGFRTLPFAGAWVWYPPKLYGLRPIAGGRGSSIPPNCVQWGVGLVSPKLCMYIYIYMDVADCRRARVLYPPKLVQVGHGSRTPLNSICIF